MPGVGGAAALNISGGGALNGGNLSVAVSGNGVTTGCINFFNAASPDACDRVRDMKVSVWLIPFFSVSNPCV
jgi:hypothetical protein